MRILRILAQLIDLLLGFGALMAAFLWALPALAPLLPHAAARAVLALALAILLTLCLQLPFLRTGQTVGKAFFGIRVLPAGPERAVSVGLMLHREILCKLMSCYIICIPVLLGKPGGHETATGTLVSRASRGNAASKERTASCTKS